MRQTRLFITTNAAAARKVSAILEDVFEEDGWPVSAFEVDEDNGIWSVSVYADTEHAQEAETRMTLALEAADLPTGIGHEPLDDDDWVAKTLRELVPVRSGRFIVHGSHDRDAPRAHEHAMLIDAGLAFGTGHHGTTAGCLDMLGQCLKENRYHRALDLGTGSGVLAIAVAKALPARILATDIDPVAVRVAKENCRLNHVASRIRCETAPGFSHRAFREEGPFDLVIANILAGPLQALARDLAANCAPGATVILSGLLPHQKARIVATYRQHGMDFIKAHIRDNWLVLVLRKRG
ncbi:MAG: 50S ribosomal protein L11 methyltransferase [Nitratireductor sp.]|nr:50S ribosomal protein L11 methyltransferase [Nitratireductor sp.]